MKIVFNKSYEPLRSKVMNFIKNFETQGLQLGNPKRNSIKVFDSDGLKLNIKSFKIPNLFNRFVYDTFRKSKAERSFNYANRLLDMGIGTPRPVAYIQNSSFFSFKESYFISEQLDSDYTFRDLSQNFDLENREQILKAFTRFTFNLHEKGIYFLDHSPGNTLIKIVGDSYKFYLVDLNRMEFKALSLTERIQNFSRLTPDRNVISILSKEYARCIGADPAPGS
ncbi:MAG: Kdo domain containing protein [Bacteroidetes bacterium]|nr:Kdo domain containing protein [Bacteroidota bacterium]